MTGEGGFSRENFFIYIPQQTTKTVRIWCSAACHGVIVPIKSEGIIQIAGEVRV
jgi:hypothetical protein